MSLKYRVSAHSVLENKRDRRWRLRVDCKPHSIIAVDEKLPGPRINELLERFQGSAVDSSLYFAGAFLHIPVHPGDKHKTTFPARRRSRVQQERVRVFAEHLAYFETII